MPDGVVVLEELRLLGILERNEHHRVAAGGHHAPGQPDDGVLIAADGETITQFEAGGDVGHRLVVTARDLASGDQIGRPSGGTHAAGRDADHHGPDIALALAYLHGQVGHVGGLGDARHREDAAVDVIVEAGRLRVGTQGVLLHHPEVGTTVVEQRLAVIHHAPVHAGHDQGHADQQTQADAGEDELAPGMQDVAAGQADHCGTPGICSTTWMRLCVVSAFSL